MPVRLVKKLEQSDIAGVCIEDKLFPKTNSFIKGEAQPLADIEEFCYKIKAMKDTQKDDDFVVISRVEAFIAGWGLTGSTSSCRSIPHRQERMPSSFIAKNPIFLKLKRL